MHAQSNRRSSIFLLELLFAILFFMIASTFCVKFFISSHTLEEKSTDLNHAVSTAVSAAELLHADDSSLTLIREEYPFSSYTKNTLSVFFDENWISCEEANATYTMYIDLTYENSFLVGTVRISRGQASLYELPIKYYRPEGGDF